MAAFSLSLSLSPSVADRRSEYVFMLVWFLLGTLVYFLFFVHLCIYGRLSSNCLWYINDGGCGSWGMGDGQAVCSQLTSFFVLFLFVW